LKSSSVVWSSPCTDMRVIDQSLVCIVLIQLATETSTRTASQLCHIVLHGKIENVVLLRISFTLHFWDDFSFRFIHPIVNSCNETKQYTDHRSQLRSL
jgi:hypothetical protein